MANLNENRLWKWFSRYIRLRDANDKGSVRCFTCGVWRHWKGMDAGHGISRRNMATKYHEINVQPQCGQCNCFAYGAQDKFAAKVDETYGAGTWDELVRLSRTVKKFSQFELDQMADEYKEKATQAALEKGLKINS